MRFLIAIIFLTLLPVFGFSQGQADWWYFGQLAGIHFTGSGPVADTNGALTTSEGNSTISDSYGNLLFYSDGISVWNKNHQQMPNGFGLLGNPSSTQSGVVLPYPGSSTKYIQLSVQELAFTEGLRYSVVDMTLNGGLGDVDASQKNVLIYTPTCEKVAAIRHANGQDIWIVTHQWMSDTFVAFHVSPSGVNLTPVLSSVGSTYTGSIGNTIGYLKATTDGTKLVSAIQADSLLEIFDFNTSTGELTNPISLNVSVRPYGVEFSPDKSKVYTAGWNSPNIIQFDLSSGVQSTIQNTETVVGVSASPVLGALQLGPDQKIYVARHIAPFIGAIDEPNELGLACNYVDSAVNLLGRNSTVGFPTFIQNFLSVGFDFSGQCLGDLTSFSADTAGIDSVFWSFGDPASGTADTSTQYNPTHTFTDTGSFTVMLIARAAGDTVVDTAFNTVYIYPRQSLEFGSDTVLCSSDSLVLNIAQDFSTYLWQDSSTADSFVVYEDSLIYATLFGVCDTITDTIQVTFDDSIKFELGNDTLFCVGNSLELDAEITVNASMFWSTGDTVDSIFVTTSGTYELNAFNACGPFTDTINITVVPLPDTALLPPDTLNCFDVSILLERPNLDGVTYVWSDSSSKKTYQVDTTELVWLAAFNECGFSVDTMNLVFNGEIKTELGEDTTICPEDSVMMIATSYPEATYVWNTGDTTDTLRNLVDESKNYIVTVTYKQCQKIESKRVDLDELVCPTINCDVNFANVITPNADGINDIFRVWSDCAIEEYTLSIYNRWGQLVHYSNTANFGWDGYINGELASQGVYFFEMTFRDQVVVNVDRDYFRGSFSLLH